ncbi:WD40/YVTN/BNR-like repeat-containing protein [Novosphingobium sp. BL-52-GroH]|uniref:WD40/YVTN/BNR-like repeat-containing protein n=1 Tax=Novosphingobium sp. BL-52-GroH TaxID=3349877 RepID=UPI00384DAA95
MNDINIVIGTIGSGTFWSHDSGRTWEQAVLKMPVAPWAPWIEFRSVNVSPFNKNHVIGGSDSGIHLSEDGGKRWEFIDSPLNGMRVWSTTWHPHEPDTILVGAAPFETDKAVYRTRDRGKTWENLKHPLIGRSGYGATHITHVAYDPRDPRTMWAGAEIGGLWYSKDDGQSWTKTDELGPADPDLAANIFEDIHSFSIGPEGNLYIATPRGVQVSYDDGKTFNRHVFEPFPDREPTAIKRDIVSYCRCTVVKTDDPNTIFVTVGDYTPGKNGAIYRSKDKGHSWERLPLPVPPNTTMYWAAVHPEAPDTIVACSMYGYIYISRDGGDSWEKVKREFGEIRAITFAPQ